MTGGPCGVRTSTSTGEPCRSWATPTLPLPPPLVTTLALVTVTMAEHGHGGHGGHGGHVSLNVIHSGHDGGYGGGHGGHGAHGVGGYGKHDHYAPAYYGFEYGVNDPHYGANFGHKEQRDGYKTSGSYYVDLPDGRRQKVSYTADEYGYHPVVTYEGYAKFPETKGHGHGGYHK